MSNTYELRGKSALVTGGAKGIGRAIAELLVANGASVTVWDRTPASAPSRVRSISLNPPDDLPALYAPT